MVHEAPHGKKAIVLIGHGAVAKDCPRELVMQMKTLEARRQTSGGEATKQELELDARIRQWPRTPATDPYQAGLESFASSLQSLVNGAQVAEAYLEFCAPTLEQVVDDLVSAGVTRVIVVPSMLTPGGVHSEVDIPEILARLRTQYPHVALRYAWPFDLSSVAHMLAEHLLQFQ